MSDAPSREAGSEAPQGVEGVRPRVLVVAIFLLSLTIHLGALIARPVTERGGLGGFGDTWVYLRIAYNLGEHHVFSQSERPPRVPTTQKPPLYPVFLAVLLRMGFESPGALRWVQAAMSGLVPVFVFLAAWALRGRRLDALAAAGLAVLCPFTVHHARHLLSDWLGVVVFAAFLAVASWAARRKRVELSAAAGLLVGLMILVRPAMLPFGLLLTPAWMLAWPDGWRRRVAAAALLALTLVAVVGSWTWRNYRVSGRRVLVTTGGMANGLLLGTWETPQNWDWVKVPREAFDDDASHQRAVGLIAAYHEATEGGTDELLRVNAELRKMAHERMRARPLRYLQLCIGRLPVLWWITECGERDPPGLFIMPYLIVWLLALPVLCRIRNGMAWILWSLPVYVTLMHLPAHCEPRFTLPAFPALCVVGGLGIAWLVERFRRVGTDGGDVH